MVCEHAPHLRECLSKGVELLLQWSVLLFLRSFLDLRLYLADLRRHARRVHDRGTSSVSNGGAGKQHALFVVQLALLLRHGLHALARSDRLPCIIK